MGKHDWRVIADSHRIKVARESYDHWAIYFRNAIYMDEGMYECTAENIAGKVYCKADVKIQEKAGIIRNPSFKHVAIEDYFHIIDEIGRGSCGVIRRVIDKNSANQYAAKFLRYSDEMHKAELQTEHETMSELDHENIIQVIDGYDDKKRLAIVMEMVSGGELFQRILKEDSFRESEAAFYIRQLLLATEYMHSRNVVHLDLTPENLWLYDSKSDLIKVIDFGYAKLYSTKRDVKAKYCTPEFCSPEVANEEKITPAADMWSIGVITYIMLTGCSPFYKDTYKETLEKIKKCEWEFDKDSLVYLSKDAKDFVSSLLIKDPKKRLSASKAVEHKFVDLAFHRGLGERINVEKLRGYVFRRKWQRGMNLVKTFASAKPISDYYKVESESSKENKLMELEIDVPLYDLVGDVQLNQGVASPTGSLGSRGSSLPEVGAAGLMKVMGPPSVASEAGSIGSGSGSEWGRDYEDEDTWYDLSSSYPAESSHLMPSGDSDMSMRMAGYRRKAGVSTGPR